METRGVIADYQPDEGMLTVWNSTQAAHRVKEHISDMLQYPEDGLRVITPEVGGTFGMKDCIFPEDILVPYLSMLLQKPVKWIEDRQENLLAYHGRGMDLEMELAVKSDGTILGMKFTVFADLGAYFLLTTASAPFNALRRVAGPYHIPAVELKMVGAVTNKTPTGAYRGTGGPESALCMERSLDMIAQDMGLDPVEVRQRNFVPVDAFPYETATGVTYDSADYGQGFERALELADYYRWKTEAAQRDPHGPAVGVGIAAILKSSGASGHHREERARVAIGPDGTVSVYTGISPHGQGNVTSFAQMAAEELGVDPSSVSVHYGDTAEFPFGFGTSASRGLIVGGSAVFSALTEARGKMAEVAAHMLNCSPDDVRLERGRAYDVNTPDAGIAVPELATAAHNGELLPVGLEPGLDFTTSFTLPDNPPFFCRSRGSGRGQQGHRPCRDSEIRGGARLRTDHQPLDCGGANPWRHRPRHRPSLDRGYGLLSGWAAVDREPDGLRRSPLKVNARLGAGHLERPVRHQPFGSQGHRVRLHRAFPR